MKLLKYFTFIILTCLCIGCTTIPQTRPWPSVPERLMVPPPEKLKTLDMPKPKASDLMKVVNENYGLYFIVADQLRGWQEWYLKQQKINQTLE